jgi:hypothetical protein
MKSMRRQLASLFALPGPFEHAARPKAWVRCCRGPKISIGRARAHTQPVAIIETWSVWNRTCTQITALTIDRFVDKLSGTGHSIGMPRCHVRRHGGGRETPAILHGIARHAPRLRPHSAGSKHNINGRKCRDRKSSDRCEVEIN